MSYSNSFHCKFCGDRGCLACDAVRAIAREEFARECNAAELEAVRRILASPRFHQLAEIVLRELDGPVKQAARTAATLDRWKQFEYLEPLDKKPNEGGRKPCADSTEAGCTATTGSASAKENAAASTSTGPSRARKSAPDKVITKTATSRSPKSRRTKAS